MPKIDQRTQEGSMEEGHRSPLVQPTHWSLLLRQGPPGQWVTMLSLAPRSLISQYVVCHPYKSNVEYILKPCYILMSWKIHFPILKNLRNKAWD